MSDNLRRSRAIRDALKQYYPGQPTGTVARHWTTLAALIRGMVASKRTQLPTIASPVPNGTKPASRVKRFTRWVGNTQVTEAGYVVPDAELVLQHLAWQPLVWVMDGSVVGRGGVALMLHVVSKGRAVPLAWQVRPGATGHCPAALHSALGTHVSKLIPPGVSVVWLGDGALDGTRLPQTVPAYHWSYVVRTGSHSTGAWDGAHCRCDTVAACIKPGPLVAWREVRMTEEAYGPIMLRCCWAKG